VTLFHALGPFASSGGVTAAPGMVLVSPTSITHSGTSATLGANGQVTFTAVTSLSLNGVFTADFDNYVVSVRYVAANGSGGGDGTNLRWRAAGSDDSTASSYVRQALVARSTSVVGVRATDNKMQIGFVSDQQRSGEVFFFYGPYLAQPTAARSNGAQGRDGGSIYELAGTHNQSTSYDGFTFFPNAGDMTGALQVYGVRS
jgi:hypothetical protein